MISRRKDNIAEGKDDGWLKSDMGYLKRGQDEMRLDVKELSRKQDEMSEKVVRLEESTKQAHKRLDTVERRLNHMGGDDE